MNRWRLKHVRHLEHQCWIIQKRLFGFLWWYNPDNIDGVVTGIYPSREMALRDIEYKTTKPIIKYEEIKCEEIKARSQTR